MEQTTSATKNITFKDILARFRNESVTEHDKGAKFEKLIKRWFLTVPEYANVLDKVWLWEEFPGKESMGGVDLGIDLVAKTDEGKFWAIQCKCYQDDAVISKKMVDSFIANANRQFIDDEMHTIASISCFGYPLPLIGARMRKKASSTKPFNLYQFTPIGFKILL